MTTDLVTTNGTAPAVSRSHDARAFEPGDMQQALYLADVLFAGKLLPAAFKSPEAVVTAIILGRELGLSAMQSIRGIHVIEGKPTLSAEMMVALVKRSPLCKYFRLVHSDAESATYETHRVDEPAPTSMTYAKADAIAAGKWGTGNWLKHPAPMLRARSSSGLARAVYPDLMMGVYDPDELEPVQAAPQYYREPGRAVDTGTGEVIEGTVIVSTDPAPAPTDLMPAFGGQDNQLPKQVEPKPERTLANQALMARFTELAQAIEGANSDDAKAARDKWLKSEGHGTVSTLLPEQKRSLCTRLEIEGAAETYRIFVQQARDARWTKEANAREAAEAAPVVVPVADEDIPPFLDGHTGSVAGLEAEG